ncbi:MAG: phBC6A51 family helix-turn-helix protein [Patescibacteria group bacterium]|nr:phBC6A51 family helix-turn-helix protein [Patescibacteria group bacterium]
MKKDRIKTLFLEHIRRIPIIQVACEKVGVARSSVYRWRDEDKEFRKELEEALAEGEILINEMSESQLISLIRDKSWQAISFWLRKRSPKFRDRVEVTGNIESRQNELTPEQQAVVTKALRLASLGVGDKDKENNYEQHTNSDSGGTDVQGS